MEECGDVVLVVGVACTFRVSRRLLLVFYVVLLSKSTLGGSNSVGESTE